MSSNIPYSRTPEGRRAYYEKNKAYILQRQLEYVDRNKDKRKETLQQYHLNNRDRIIEKNKKWDLDNPEAARIRGIIANQNLRYKRIGSNERLTSKDWRKLFEVCNGRCLCCGSTDELEIDHVIPVSQGGRNHLSNLQLLCNSCNSKKHIHSHDYRKLEIMSKLT